MFPSRAQRHYNLIFYVLSFVKFMLIYESFSLLTNKEILAQKFKHQRCFSRLENALEHMRRRSSNIKSSRTLWEETPYTLYNSFYGPQTDPGDDFYNGGRGYFAKNINRNSEKSSYNSYDGNNFSRKTDTRKNGNNLSVSGVDVEDLKVKIPPKQESRWVEIDKCIFSTENSTLDTRLIFPDLTLSGKVVLQPTGGKCHMILRLRHAGIEFRTVPIGFETSHGNEQSRRIGSASVRTDSHFAEPGFISVFAHGCQGPTGIRLRQNSKRRYSFINDYSAPAQVPEIELSEPQVIMGSSSNRWGKYHNPYKPPFDIRNGNYKQAQKNSEDVRWENDSGSQEFFDINGDNFYRRKFRRRRDLDILNYLKKKEDDLSSNRDVFNFSDEQFNELIEPDARTLANIFSQKLSSGPSMLNGYTDQDEISDAMTNELEKLFSLGVRGLLTTYMQKTLQPAIKETLMENMGYRLSYG